MKGWSSAKVPDLISVIVTTYNREDALEAVLSALSRQADRGFIILEEDGRLIPKVIKNRRPEDESEARFSRKLVQRCLAKRRDERPRSNFLLIRSRSSARWKWSSSEISSSRRRFSGTMPVDKCMGA